MGAMRAEVKQDQDNAGLDSSTIWAGRRHARKQAISNGGGPRFHVYSSDCSIARPDSAFPEARSQGGRSRAPLRLRRNSPHTLERALREERQRQARFAQVVRVLLLYRCSVTLPCCLTDAPAVRSVFASLRGSTLERQATFGAEFLHVLPCNFVAR